MSYSREPASLLFRLPGQIARVTCEIANTPELRERGLMGRERLDGCTGMLFIWPDTALRAMWMKRTPLPLDIVFLDDLFRVVNIEQGVPFSLLSRQSRVPVRYVLETSGGWCKREGVHVGTDAIPVRVPAAVA